MAEYEKLQKIEKALDHTFKALGWDEDGNMFAFIDDDDEDNMFISISEDSGITIKIRETIHTNQITVFKDGIPQQGRTTIAETVKVVVEMMLKPWLDEFLKDIAQTLL